MTTDAILGALVCLAAMLLPVVIFVWIAVAAARADAGRELTDEEWREWLRRVLSADDTQP